MARRSRRCSNSNGSSEERRADRTRLSQRRRRSRNDPPSSSRRIGGILLLALASTATILHLHQYSEQPSVDSLRRRQLKEGGGGGGGEYQSASAFVQNQIIEHDLIPKPNPISSRKELVAKGYTPGTPKFNKLLNKKMQRRTKAREERFMRKFFNRILGEYFADSGESSTANEATGTKEEDEQQRKLKWQQNALKWQQKNGVVNPEYEKKMKIIKSTANNDNERIYKSVELTSPHTYTFSTNSSMCINPKEVEVLASMLNDLYEIHDIRAIPRNGFLLGIIRHGGFLPNENVPDADLGIISKDVDRWQKNGYTSKSSPLLKLGDFILSPKPNENDWVNWKGFNPANGKTPYSYFGVRIKRLPYSIRANAMYPYEKKGRYIHEKQDWSYFFPRVNRAGYNHNSHIQESLRYNEEGANYRLLDTDELLTKKNYNNQQDEEPQIGTVFNTTFDCMMLKQFYFTRIYVPCDYDEVLTAFFGKNWNHVESRALGGKGSQESRKLSVEEQLDLMKNGPKPLCAEGVTSSIKILDY